MQLLEGGGERRRDVRMVEKERERDWKREGRMFAGWRWQRVTEREQYEPIVNEVRSGKGSVQVMQVNEGTASRFEGAIERVTSLF